MAPPRHRRRGFSRRVQYSLFAGYVIAVVGAVGALGLVLLSRFDPQGFMLLRGAVLDVTAPISGAGRAVVRGGRAIHDEVAAYIDAGAQNRALRAELDAARRRLIRDRALERENQRLRAIVRLRENHPAPIIVARIVGSSVAAQRRFATLSAGSADGVRPGQPVRSSDGLVGRVFETGRAAARILLLTDGGSVVPVRIARGGTPALATGRGDGSLDLRALIGGGRPFRAGDIAFTSGTGGVYAPDIPVAVVVSVSGDTARAWPLADPARLDFAIVEPVYQFALPPAPAPIGPPAR